MSGSNNNRTAPPAWSRWIIFAIAAGFLLTMVFGPSLNTSSSTEIPYNEFLNEVKTEQVDSIKIDNTDGEISGERADGTKFTTNGPLTLSDEDRAILDNSNAKVEFDTPQSSPLLSLLGYLLPIALIVGFFVWIQRRAQGQMSGIMSIGRSKAKTYSTEKPGTTFDDVAGYAGVKQEITEVVDFLKNPERFSSIGARIPKGILLVGPPGTGKTLIARAVAGEAGVPFMSVTGSDFMEMFVGVGASRVRDLFDSARKAGKAIIFIDEIDSIGRKRGAGLGGGHDEREQTLNQMLAEMDGFEATEGIVMMAATNRPDILDPALLRPGRFDREVIVPLPELQDRLQILDVHMKGKRVASDVDVNMVARGTPGMSGADLSNLVNEAALFAVREGDSEIHMKHFELARDRVMMGQTRDTMALTPADKERIAYHEAGHAIAGVLTPNGDPLHKVTIIPRGMALGVTMRLPEHDKYLLGQTYVEDELIMMLGGRTAERLIFGELSSGASDDLARATDRARAMVTQWGMSPRVGPLAWRQQEGQVFLGDGMNPRPDYSDDMAVVIDEEIERILRDADRRCTELLTRARNGLDLVARSLLEHETIEGEEVLRLLRLAGVEIPERTSTAARTDAGNVPSGGSFPIDHGAPTPEMVQTSRHEEPR